MMDFTMSGDKKWTAQVLTYLETDFQPGTPNEINKHM